MRYHEARLYYIFSKSDQFAVEAVRRHSRGRVVRIGDKHQSGLHRHFLGNLAQIYNVMILFFCGI